MTKIKCVLEGLFGKFPDKEFSRQLEVRLQKEFCYVDPLDLNSMMRWYQDGVFYAGIYHKLGDVLSEYGYELEIEFPPLKEVFLNKTETKYRPFQEEAVTTALEKRYGIIQAPPGLGKTACASKIIQSLGAKAIILVEDTAPFDQAVKALKQFCNIDAHKIKTRNYTYGDVNVAMIQTLLAAHKRNSVSDQLLFDHCNEIEVVIIDEVHHTQADSYIDMLHLFPNAKYIIGMSATPYSTDGRNSIIYSLVGPVIYEVPYGACIDAGILVPTTLFTEDVPVLKAPSKAVFTKYTKGLVTGLQKYKTAVEDHIVNNDERNRMIMEFVAFQNKEGRSCAIIVDKLEHANKFHKMSGGKIAIIEGKTPAKTRNSIKHRLATKELLCVVSTLFDEAVDIPTLDAIVYASGGKSRVKAIQRLRCTRSAPDKERGYAYLPIDSHPTLEKHSKETLKHLEEFFGNHPKNEIIRL